MKLLNIIGGVLTIGGFFLMLGSAGTLEIDDGLTGWLMVPYILMAIMGAIGMVAGVLILEQTHRN